MLVRFIGQAQRVNSYGVFEPGREYDVSAEVGKILLSAPNLFVEVNVVGPRANTALEQVIDVTGKDAEGKYASMNIKQLESMVRKRGLTTRRGARKAEFIQLLEQNDREVKIKKDGDDSGDIETTDILGSGK